MKVSELKEFLETQVDDAEVVMRGSDHNFYPATVSGEDAVYIAGELYEPDGTEPFNKRVDVVVFW